MSEDMVEKRKIFGMLVKIDPTIPPDEIRLVDPASGNCVVKIVNVRTALKEQP